jgi:DNA-binding response OmpR family regulator
VNAKTKLSVLIAEDEMLLAMLLSDLMENAGYRVLMIARLAKGLELAASEPIDVAILDINLAGQDSFPLADALCRRGIPFVFASGYGRDDVPEAYRDVAVLQKPYDTAEIQAAIATLLRAKAI